VVEFVDDLVEFGDVPADRLLLQHGHWSGFSALFLQLSGLVAGGE